MTRPTLDVVRSGAASSRPTNTTIGRDSIRTLAARLLVSIVGIATGIVAARWLGPAGKGVYSGTLMLVSTVMVVPTGVAGALTYALTKQGRSLSQVLPATGMLLAWLTAAVGLGALVWGAERGWNLPLVVFVAAALPATILAWQGAFYIGLGRLRNLNYQTAGLGIATFVGVGIAVVILHRGVMGALIAWLACQYGAAAVVTAHVLRMARNNNDPIALWPTVRELLGFGGQASANLLLGVINYRIDSVILIAMLGVAPFGIYTLAVSFGETLFWLTRPVATAAGRELGIRSPESSAAITAKVVRTCTAFVGVASVAAFMVGPALIDAIYGSRFRDAAAPLRILLPGIVAFSTAGTFAAFFMLQLGRPLIIAVTNIIMISVQAAMCFALVPRFGMSGAAFASTITYIAGAVLNTVWFCRATGMRPIDLWVVRREDVRTAWTEITKIIAPLRMLSRPSPT
jgi:O-antigen/teichoic acid export membrane protein